MFFTLAVIIIETRNKQIYKAAILRAGAIEKTCKFTNNTALERKYKNVWYNFWHSWMYSRADKHLKLYQGKKNQNIGTSYNLEIKLGEADQSYKAYPSEPKPTIFKFFLREISPTKIISSFPTPSNQKQPRRPVLSLSKGAPLPRYEIRFTLHEIRYKSVQIRG
jgi:hypothetical protein